MTSKEDLLKELTEKIKKYPDNEQKEIINAYEFSEKYHSGQKRASGDEFIVHPLSIAIRLADMNVDHDMIMAGLLHDVVEDTDATLDELKETFGAKIAELVDGVTKISKLKPDKSKDADAETIRKMLFAMIKDMKIIVIKLADKLHNMSTLNFLPAERRKSIALETLEIYAPLAGKLGMHLVKDELEDLALRWIYPDIYKMIRSHFDKTNKEMERTRRIVSGTLSQKLDELKIPAKIKSRTKHYYSIYKKMKKYNKRIDEIFDLYGVRVKTDTVNNCYQIFGIIHNIWQPIPGRFRDFIAHPKKNGYRSLHTTVLVEPRKAVEIQIRTEEMDEINEYGVAAHWYYKKGQHPDPEQIKWLSRLMEVNKESLTPEEYYQTIRDDILKDEMYVFTPKGDTIELPKGSTALDFAYRIHTEIGHRCIGAKANGAIISLDSPLKNGMIVEIMTGKTILPKQAWISMAKTSVARKKIRSWFASRRTDEQESKKEDHKKKDEAPLAQAERNIPKKDIRRPEAGRDINIAVSINGEKNLMYSFAKCCSPSPYDEIVGFISRGRGIIVHKSSCHNLKFVKDIEKRSIHAEWAEIAKKKKKI